ncbi:hypothetical protein [Bifidobacterium adolescentis]
MTFPPSALFLGMKKGHPITNGLMVEKCSALVRAVIEHDDEREQ